MVICHDPTLCCSNLFHLSIILLLLFGMALNPLLHCLLKCRSVVLVLLRNIGFYSIIPTPHMSTLASVGCIIQSVYLDSGALTHSAPQAALSPSLALLKSYNSVSNSRPVGCLDTLILCRRWRHSGGRFLW